MQYLKALTKPASTLVNSLRHTSSSQPADYIRTNLHNGVGRYVCQLQRITFKFCKEHPNSRGIREFIETDLVNFARKNPGTVVYLQPRRHRKPKMFAEYLNGSTQTFDIAQQSREQIAKWLELYRTRNGHDIVRLLKPNHTDNPSIQGVWNPFTNKTPQTSIKQFPSEDYNKPADYKPTATDKILELYEKQNKNQ